MGAITDATDEELQRYAVAIRQEQDRRRTLATAEQKSAELNAAYLSASGVEPGQEWRQPVGAVDAYPEGWEVVHEGKTWTSTTPANVWPPGVSGWREVAQEGEDGEVVAPEWVTPTGAHDAYGVGDRVTFEGAVYESVISGNVWAPSAYPAGWKRVEENA